ncbi:uncharacterized protein LOC106175817 [Lingula anatina]|uniref:Uncharacterized protein LOC106175817 n=1 Tax=Lingula anatina TaxID=7574 RepID=A0A1S3JSS6_LINAN|nr:uncharacterized protein LOC106175817 [Lingula anatina]|eukprot:XP_013413425.1 uncharacterized protein LOC106175817 [Lingula anatina]
MKTQGHKLLLMLLILLTFAVYIAILFMNFLSSSWTLVGQDFEGLFLNNTGDVSDYFYLEITPAGWTFSIWGFIYTWQFLWLIYVATSMCRKSTMGSYLYVDPQLVPTGLFFVFIINNVLNVAWLILFDRMLIIWSMVDLFLTTFSLYVALFLTHRQLEKIAPNLVSMKSVKDIWMIRFFVQNGLAFYATWCTIASLLNTAIVLSYTIGIKQDIACTIVLGVLAGEILVWFGLDIFVFDRYTRYNFSPIIVLILALSGSLAKNWDPEKRNSIITVAILGVAVVIGLVKVILMFYRHCTRPLYSHLYTLDKI